MSALYDFASVGTGAFSFAPVTTFQTAPTDQKVAARSDLVTVEVSTSPITIEVTGDVSRVEPSLNRRARDICTTASRKTFIDSRFAFF